MNRRFSIRFFKHVLFVVFAMLSLQVDTIHGQQSDAQSVPANWARWRGPAGNGISTNQQPVTSWSETENVIWRTKVPGKGHASPIVTDTKIFLATADEQAQTQSVVAFDRETGKQIWNTVVNTGGLPKKIHAKNTHASSTIALGDGLIYVVVYHRDQVHIAALDLDGKIVRTHLALARRPSSIGLRLSCPTIT